MRAWIFAAVCTAVAVGGVYVAVAGSTTRSHCGPCLIASCSPDVSVAGPETPCEPVTEVVDLTVALAPPLAEPGGLPFISFDEPPFAKPTKPTSDAAVLQTTFIAPIGEEEPGVIEVAPPPRSRRATGGPTPLYGPHDPF